MKQLCFDGWSLEHASQSETENLLRLLIPESPKAIELNQRLTNEITPKQRETLHSWQIEKLENNIKNEIELKYSTFDANQLSEMSDNNDDNNNTIKQKYKYKWSTSIEMLSFHCYSLTAVNLTQSLKDKLTPLRVTTGIFNGWSSIRFISLCMRHHIE